MKSKNYIASFDEINLSDIPTVGGKNASLGEMIQNLSNDNIRIPSGFAITVKAFHEFMDFNNLQGYINKGIFETDFNDISSLRNTGRIIRKTIMMSQFPKQLKKDIKKAYRQLSKSENNTNSAVAVRSSATTED